MDTSRVLPNNNRAFGGSRGAAVHAQGSKQRGQMDFDCSLAEPKFSRNFLVRIALPTPGQPNGFSERRGDLEANAIKDCEAFGLMRLGPVS